ncbi:MAG: Sulfatase protein [Acidobacteria bacterium]|nr:Sulfatase protein [Acidobacteriota bacterium]
MIDGDDALVFNLRRDIGERQDLASQRQDVAARLRPLIAAWESDVEDEAERTMGPQAPTPAPAPGARGRGRGATQ